MLEKTVRLQCFRLMGLALGLCAGSASAVEPRDFAVGWPLELSAESGLLDVALAVEVYREGRSIEQLAIIDADGDTMPFYRREASAPSVSERRTTLDVSPAYRRGDDAASTELRIETTDERGRVAVTRPGRRGDQRIIAFLADARAVDGVVSEIELHWAPLERPFLMRVRIEHSTDVTRWRTVGRASIASLLINGERVRHGRVPVEASGRGYYRVSWDERVPDWRLERIELVGTAADAPGPDERLAARLSPAAPPAEGAQDGALYFDAGGVMPVTSVRLAFSSQDDWADARLAARASPAGRWRAVTNRRVFYRVEAGGRSLSSAAVEVPRVEARYWRVAFDAGPRGDVALELAVPREHLRFAARGRAPYMLAGGTRLDAAGPDETFAAVVGELDDASTAAGTAELGPRVELGGAQALLEPPRAFPWQTAVLWAVLVTGGLLVVGMAVRLARELRG